MLRKALLLQPSKTISICKNIYKRCKHRQVVTRTFPSIGSELEKVADEKGSTSSSLMQKHKLIQNASSGTHYYMPSLTRSLEKLVRVIDREMNEINAQKVVMPCLSPEVLWKKSGRWEVMGSELFQMRDRNGSMHCLSPTHEEAITSVVVQDMPISYKRLPIKLYQIGKKFRDEMRPKHGLLRCREFEMKDLYTFDASKEDAQTTFDEVCEAYENILRRLELPFVMVEASTGSMGGTRSMEFQLLADAGEDKLYRCQKCGHGVNKELIADETDLKCRVDSCDGSLKEQAGIEVAHAFILDTKYSDIFKAKFMDRSGNKKSLVMGCFGIGVSRLLAASVEVLSSADKLCHSPLLAPYQICLIPQKKGHRFEDTWALTEGLYDRLERVPSLRGEVVIDDRVELSIGERIRHMAAAGYPFLVGIGKKALDPAEPQYELIENVKGSTKTARFLTLDELLAFAGGIETVNIAP